MTIDAPSTSTNSDSIFPALRGVAEHSPTIPSPAIPSKVLVMEHDSALRGLIADVFDFEGYCVTEAGNDIDLQTILRTIRFTSQRKFDLIVVGFQAEGDFNLDTLTQLRDDGCSTPAIVLAHASEAPIDQRMLELDVAVLTKPFALENLRIIANHVLHARPGKSAYLD
jgi:DNA-binding response OmpR family regulator